jgi:hypothetical protein
MHEVRAEDGADPKLLGGTLELDRAVDPLVSVQASAVKPRAAAAWSRDSGLEAPWPKLKWEWT